MKKEYNRFWLKEVMFCFSVFKGDQEFKQGVKAPIISGEIYEDLNSGIDGLTIFKK